MRNHTTKQIDFTTESNDMGKSLANFIVLIISLRAILKIKSSSSLFVEEMLEVFEGIVFQSFFQLRLSQKTEIQYHFLWRVISSRVVEVLSSQFSNLFI
jgi:hypothetical protein